MSDLEARVKKLEDTVIALTAMSKPVAADIDGQYGDPDVRKDPPQWKGESFIGKKFSECSPEYLESLAAFCDWKVGKNLEELIGGQNPDAEKYLKYARTDAARARAWAERNRKSGSPWDAP